MRLTPLERGALGWGALGWLVAVGLLVCMILGAATGCSSSQASREQVEAAQERVDAVFADPDASDEQLVRAIVALRAAIERDAAERLEESSAATARLGEALPYGLTGIAAWAATEWNRNRKRRRRGERTDTKPDTTRT